MTISKQIQIALAFVLAVSLVCQAVENPNVSTSSFRANNTVPSQGNRARTITQPTSSGNDIITGNVSGGRHFRGFVPYGSTYYSGGNLTDYGSSSVNNFVRRSVNPVVSDRNPAQSRPYYQASRTASSFRQQTGGSSSISADILTGRTMSSTYDLPPLPPSVTQTTKDQRPLSSNNLELETILSRQFDLSEAAKKTRSTEQTDTSSEQERAEFEQFFDTLPKRPQEKDTPSEDIKRAETEATVKPELEVLDEIQQEAQEAMVEQKSSRTSLRQQRLDEAQAAEQLQANPDSAATPEPINRVMEYAEAASIRGEHKTYESLAEAKFTAYMQAAENFVVEGKYYKAADAYDLALVWGWQDPRPYAGKSFSLFAAGEYMSSAYYLSRAIELNPQLAAKEVNVARLLGDRDVYETRLLEINTWQQRSGAGELAFLLAYLYHHDDKPLKAEEALTTAALKMPDSMAVKTLGTIISGQSGQ